MTRMNELARYRHLRRSMLATSERCTQICQPEHDAGIWPPPGDFAVGDMLVADSEDELALVFDLAVHTSRGGRSRAIDRYARIPCVPHRAADEA